MAQGFSERAQRVNELLGDTLTTFLLVTAPEREPIDEAIYFWRRLKEAKPALRRRRRQQGPPRLPDGGRDAVERAGGRRSDQLVETSERALDGTREDAELAAKVRENFERYRVLAERDRENIALLTGRLDEDRVIEVPYFDEDVHDIARPRAGQPLPVRVERRAPGAAGAAMTYTAAE